VMYKFSRGHVAISHGLITSTGQFLCKFGRFLAKVVRESSDRIT
jgi:hypothetical protein